ncbi:MAG: ATP-binding protein, partial [Puniceicoccales bacterium]
LILLNSRNPFRSFAMFQHSMTLHRAAIACIAALIFLCGGRPLLGAIVELTEEEKAWIEAHPVVTVGADAEFPPFEFEDQDGNVVGLSLAYLDIITATTGLKFEIKSAKRWQNLLTEAESGELDLLAAAVPTDVRLQTLNFSQPYAVFPSVIATRENTQFVGSLRNLVGRKVAVVEGFFEEDILRKDYPSLTLVTYPSRREALYAVAHGDATAYIGNLAIISYLIRRENFDNLQIAAPTTFNRIGLCMASRDPMLISIINKGLATVTPLKQNELEQEWIAVKYQEVEYVVFGRIGIALLTVIGIGLIWNFSLNRQVMRRKKAEKELSAANESLKVAKARAEEANTQKSEFLGIAAHDLKNPLSSIRGLAELIEDDVKRDDLSPQQKNDISEMLSTIQEAANHMLHLIRELLNVERIDSGQASASANACIALGPLVEDVVEFNRPAAAKKSITIHYAKPDSSCVILGELNRLREILDNIINNAVKYSPIGATVTVDLQTSPKRKLIEVRVKDEGPGLSEDDLQKLFGRFSRGSATPTGGECSTGLGLSIVKKLVEQMKGKVSAANREDRQGSVFTVTFPEHSEG